MTDAQRDDLIVKTHTAVHELRVVVMGMNGNGLIGEIETMKNDDKTIVGQLAELNRNAVTHEQCAAVQKATAERKQSRWLVVKNIALLMLGGGGAVGTALSIMRALH